MGKKGKVGKQRKDRFYQLAKETGYRSRASFKLIQLNRKFEFLQKSRVAIDLCAAPGGWLQVCQKYMPVSSIIIGVDLVKINPIHNVITLQEDITTQKCRKAIEKELKTWKADLVLNDGAPNVGKNWLHDSFSQARLTLSALQLACDFLIKGGTFVTKIFRSKDYNALMWVLSKLFKKVSATKPQASRNESAEIFVVCQYYLAPDKIDPKFFDPSFLFDETGDAVDERKLKADLLKPNARQKKAKAEGYRDGDYTCFSSLKASDFIKNSNHLEMLSQASEIIIDMDEIAKHELTTDELKECLKDIKVLGRRELLQVINWRRKLKEKLFKEEKQDKEPLEQVEELADDEDDAEEELVDNSLKRKKKKILKERRKLNERMNLKMVIKGDQLVEDDQELFRLSKLNTFQKVSNFEEFSMSEGESETEEPTLGSRLTEYDREERDYMINSDDEKDQEDQSDDAINDIESEDDQQKAIANAVEEDSDEEEEGLITDLGTGLNKDAKRNLFFQKGIFQDENLDSDEELALALDDKKSGQKRPASDNGDSESEASVSDYYSDSDEELTKKKKQKRKHPKCQEDVRLDPEGLALGERLIASQKARRELIDEGWNRYTRGADENLPSWFRKDEEQHFFKPMDVDQQVVNYYRDRTKGIDVRPIKKVAEAKARKKKRVLMKLEKAKKRAEAITDAPDMTEREKASHLRNLYRKATKGKKQEITYVVAKKGMANRRPKGVKGKYKVVDSRMRKDQRKKKQMDKKKGAKKRGPGGAGRSAKKGKH